MNQIKSITWGIILLLLLGKPLCWPSGKVWAQDEEELSHILSQLRDRLSSSKTFQANYIRTIETKIATKLPHDISRAEGVLYFRPPNKLRLDQKKPRAEQLVCNGDKVWWYLPQEKLVNFYRQKDYYLQIKPVLDFLSGLRSLDKNFSVHLDKNLSEEAPYYQIVLKPKTPQLDFHLIQVHVSKTTFLPIRFSISYPMGEMLLFYLSGIKTGVSLAGSWFEFIPPEGTQVISQPPELPPKIKEDR